MDCTTTILLVIAVVFAVKLDAPQQPDDAWGPTLADYALPYLTVCPRQQVPLKETFEAVSAGRWHFTMDYYETQRKEFPVSMRHLDDRSAKRAYVRFYPKCREAEEAFHEQSQSEHHH